MTEQTPADAASSTSPAPDEAVDPAPTTKRKPVFAVLWTVLAVVVAGIAFVGFRMATADDGTHGVTVGQCVAADGSDDFKQVDCGSSASLGTVTFIATDAETSEEASLSLCDKHGADSAYTASDVDGGTGTVVCVAGK
jgi:hypothetical protein